MPSPCPRMLHVQYGGASDERQSPPSRWKAARVPVGAGPHQPACRGDRLRIRGALRARCRLIAAASPVQSFKTFTSDLLAPRGLAGRLWGDQRGDGSHRRVLDPDLRNPGGPRHRGPAGERAAHQERARDERAMCPTANGYASSTASACSAGVFVPPRPLSRCGPIFAIGRAWWRAPATYVQRMQKALVQMNLQLPLVVSDITGVTGLKILRDIVAGRHDPAAPRQPSGLSVSRVARRRSSAALTGHYRPEHLFVLQQNLELFDACQTQLAACDRAIEAHVQMLTATLADRRHAAAGAARQSQARRQRTALRDPHAAASAHRRRRSHAN